MEFKQFIRISAQLVFESIVIPAGILVVVTIRVDSVNWILVFALLIAKAVIAGAFGLVSAFSGFEVRV